MTDIVFLDTETTSLLHSRRVWEVGMIVRTAEGRRTEHVFQVKNVDLTDADLFSLNIGGFFDRYEGYKGTPTGHVYTEREACVQIMQLTRGAHIVGGVPGFDTEGIESMMRRNGLRSSWHYHLVDFENLAVGYIRGLQRASEIATFGLKDAKEVSPEILKYDCNPPWNSKELSELIGVRVPDDKERHTALGDAKWAERMWDRVMGIS